MEEADPRAVANDRSGSAICLDCSVARTFRFCSVLLRAARTGFTQAGLGGGKRVRRQHGCSGTTDCGRDSQAAGTDLAGCACVVVAAEKFLELGAVCCRIAGQRCTSRCAEGSLVTNAPTIRIDRQISGGAVSGVTCPAPHFETAAKLNPKSSSKRQ